MLSFCLIYNNFVVNFYVLGFTTTSPSYANNSAVVEFTLPFKSTAFSSLINSWRTITTNTTRSTRTINTSNNTAVKWTTYFMATATVGFFLHNRIIYYLRQVRNTLRVVIYALDREKKVCLLFFFISSFSFIYALNNCFEQFVLFSLIK